MPSINKDTVFIVDDEQMLLDLAVAILKPTGYSLRTFLDAEQALKAFAHAPPAVVVTDYAMGRMNGMDLIVECRRRNPHQKVLLISGTVDGQIFANSPVKPDLFLAKPFHAQELTGCIRKLLAG